MSEEQDINTNASPLIFLRPRKKRVWRYVIAAIAVLFVIALPHLSPKETPQYDLVYGWGEGFLNPEGELVVDRATSTPPTDAHFYLHHVIANSSTPISVNDMLGYQLEHGLTSPDAFSIVRGRPGVFSLDRTPRGYVLKKGINEYPLDLRIPKEWEDKPVYFAWVVK